MTGKFFWNRPNGLQDGPLGHRGGTQGDMRDTVMLEDAVMGVNVINARKRREKKDSYAASRAANAKAKITLASPESMARLLKEISEDI